MLKKYEKLNNTSVNIYVYDSSLYLLSIIKNKLEKHVNLFYMDDQYFGLKILIIIVWSDYKLLIIKYSYATDV